MSLDKQDVADYLMMLARVSSYTYEECELFDKVSQILDRKALLPESTVD